MMPEAYHAYTARLQGRLEADGRVLGLIALGSMAARDYQPDRWSDHDFFVVVQPGAQEAFRADLAWLPEAGDIVYAYRETAHGLKVLYGDGHLLEFAVFDPAELALARVNRYRVLLDRQDLAARLERIAAETARHAAGTGEADDWLFGQFLTNLLVGAGRYRRGERLTGRHFVAAYALRHLLILLQRHVASPDRGLLDDLDPLRRVERVYPELGRRLNEAIEQGMPRTAEALLELAREHLCAPLGAAFPARAVEVVLQQLRAPVD
jgi:hypothetical protein